MFDLLSEMANKRYSQDLTKPVKPVIMVKNHESYGFSFGGALETPGNAIKNESQKPKFVTINHQLPPIQKQLKSQNTKGLSPFSPASPPSLKIFNFLRETPFTEAMIMEGLKLWQQPFDQGDIDAIKTGELSIDKAREYLFLWARQHRSRYQELKMRDRHKKTIT